jgi:TP901 family phage tail tape measure protein
MPDNVAASMTASIVLDKSDLLAQILKGLSEGQKELQNNKLEMYFDFSNSKNQAEFEKVIQKYRKQLSSQEFVVQIKDQGIDETVKSLDKLVEVVKSLASGKAFGTGLGNGKGIGNSIVDEKQLKTVINLFEKMESHLGSMRKVISDVGDGDEFSPLLTMINRVDSSISELAKKTSSLSLNMNLDFGSDDKMTAEVQSRTAKLLHTYENLFNRLKMSGTLDSNMQGYFDNFDINQYDNMNAKIAAYKNFITEMREMSKQQFGKDYLYSDIEKSYYSAVSGAQRSLNNIIKSENTSNNSIENLFGKTDLSEVISQLTIIVNKLDEISKSANNFTNVFKNGLDVNTSIQEVIDLTNRVKELETELAKIKNVTPASETNISSGSNPAIEEQNKFQSELQETASDYEKVTEAHKQMIQSAVNSIPQEENTARYVHWGNSEQSTAILSNPNGMNTGDYGLISSFADCIGEAETSMNAIVKDWDYLHAENFDKGSALIMDIPLDQVKEFEHGLKDNIPQEFIKGWVDTENGVITLNNTLQSELKETQDQAEKTAQSVKNAVSQTTKKDAFHSDIDTSSSVKSLENLEEEIKKIFTDANELQNILDSLHNGKYFHLSWTTDGIDETGADERVRQLFELLEEYGYTINNFKSDSDAFDTSGVINAIKEENNVLEQNTQKIKENTQAKEQNANANLNKYDKRLDSYNSKIDKYKTTIDRFNDGGWTSSTYLENVQAVKNAVHEYETLLNELKGKDASLVTSDDISKLDEYEKKIKDTIATVTNMSASEKGYNFVSGQKELDKIHKLLNENSKMSSEAKAKIKAYYAEIESGNPSMSLDKIHGEILKIYNAEVEAGRAGRTLWDTLKNSGFHQLAAQMAGMFGFYDVINLGKEGFNVVRELNTAFTEMRKVSDETVQSLKDYQATTFDTADAVGTTAKQIQNSTADWMRLGESMNQAAESAKDANVLLNVSEFEGIDEATESLVSMSQAYKDLDKMDIIDVLNNIGNNYSISTDGLATALKDSASALVTANNDLNEAVSLTTAGNAITQDPSKVGAGLRTISLRLVGTEEAKQELSDLGEETDGMITTVSKLRDTIMDATKAASSDGKGFDILDSNGNYKSTYEIMQGLADLYDNIVKKDKELGTNNLNLLLETIAGKNRSNIAASILQNGDMLRSVYEDAQNSEGSAEKELNSYLDSIDGKMAQLENRAQEFWFKVIDSETIKNGIDLLSTLLKGATDFVDTVGLLPTILTGIGAALSFKNVGRDKMYSLSF